MKKPVFSVIVPVYNVEKYLAECVDSILNQSFGDFELILVDDGSPDNCPAICDEYAAKDSRVRVIHKPNSGVSSARNEGIRAAAGEYILFCDSDDYYVAGALETVYNGLRDRECDILNYGYIKEYGLQGQQREKRLPDIPTFEVSSDFLIRVAFCWNFPEKDFFIEIVTHAFKRQLIQDNGIFFDEKLVKAEDSLFTLTCFAHAKNTASISAALYFYRFNPDSCMNTWTFNRKAIDNGIRFLWKVGEVLSQAEVAEAGYASYFSKSLVRVALNPCIANAFGTGLRGGAFVREILVWYFAALEENGLALDNPVGRVNKAEMFLVRHKLIPGIRLYAMLLKTYEKIRNR